MGEQTPVPLRRNRDYQLLLTGGTVSSVGTMMSELALPLLTYAETRNAAVVGVVSAAELVGVVGFGLLAGALVDRWHRGRTLVWSSLAAAVPYLLVAVAYWCNALNPVLLVVAALAVGVLSSFYDPAEGAALNLVVPDEQLPKALSAMQMRQSIADLLGPSLAGFLFGLGRVVPMVFDAVSYSVAGLCSRFVRTPLPAPKVVAQPTPMRHAVRQGVQFLFAERVLRTVIVPAAVGNAALNGAVLVATVGMQARHEPGLVIGLASVGAGLGGLAGAAVAPKILRKFRVGVASIGAMWVEQMAMILLAFQRSPSAIGIDFFVLMSTLPVINSGFGTYRMMVTPDRLQGRVRSANYVMVMGLAPLGIA